MSAQVAARTESFSFELKLKDNFVALGAPEFWGQTHLGIRGWGVAGNGSRRSSAT